MMSQPVGVFDSGWGGLSVLKEIRRLLSAEDLVYVGDSAHVPYGALPAERIVERSVALAEFCTARGAKALVVACNTATAAAVPVLRERFSVPVVGMEPAVKPATAATRTGVVGVLATVGTLQSARFAALLERFGQGVRVVTQPAPGLVEMVEAGELQTPRVQRLAAGFVRPLVEAGADVIVLGCTHYPFLRAAIAEAAGEAVTLVDTGAAVARQLNRVLTARGLFADESGGRGAESFWTTGDVHSSERVLGLLWGPNARAEKCNV